MTDASVLIAVIRNAHNMVRNRTQGTNADYHLIPAGTHMDHISVSVHVDGRVRIYCSAREYLNAFVFDKIEHLELVWNVVSSVCEKDIGQNEKEPQAWVGVMTLSDQSEDPIDELVELFLEFTPLKATNFVRSQIGVTPLLRSIQENAQDGVRYIGDEPLFLSKADELVCLQALHVA